VYSSVENNNLPTYTCGKKPGCWVPRHRRRSSTSCLKEFFTFYFLSEREEHLDDTCPWDWIIICVRHFVRKHFQSYPDLLCKTLWESLRDTHPTQMGPISKVYNQVITTIDTFSTIKAKWESELNANLTENWWVGVLRRVNTSTSCARLIQFKVVHRMHFSNSR